MLESVLTEGIAVIVQGIVAIIGLFIIYAFKKWMVKYNETELFREALKALQIGIDATQEDFVAWAKRAREDGKLTKEERAEAMIMAKNHALTHLDTGSPVFQIVKNWTIDEVNSYIKRLLNKDV